ERYGSPRRHLHFMMRARRVLGATRWTAAVALAREVPSRSGAQRVRTPRPATTWADDDSRRLGRGLLELYVPSAGDTAPYFPPAALLPPPRPLLRARPPRLRASPPIRFLLPRRSAALQKNLSVPSFCSLFAAPRVTSCPYVVCRFEFAHSNNLPISRTW